MAVYTKISDSEIAALLQNYDIGTIKYLKAIEQGIDNSNYFLTTDVNKYIFTIYEDRIEEGELPFFLGLMQHLSDKNIPCPVPLQNKNGDNLSRINNRPCAIVSFLNGKSTSEITKNHTSELGHYMAKMHIAASDFSMQRENNLALKDWGKIFNQVKSDADKIQKGLSSQIEQELGFLTVNWPKSLYSGVIHADLFPDNVFFENDHLAGIIDFYFACNDFLIYDFAICLNAWCFDSPDNLNKEKAKAMFDSYNSVRPVSEEELKALPVLARGAAMRFLLTRLHAWFNPAEDALVKPKDPMEYVEKLNFHSKITSYSQYGL